MTYRELYEKAERKLEKGEITSGEFDEMTKPLDEEIRPHGEWIPFEWSDNYSTKIPLPKGSNSHMEEYWDEEFICSVCGKAHHARNFCPNCGSDNRKRVGDEK